MSPHYRTFFRTYALVLLVSAVPAFADPAQQEADQALLKQISELSARLDARVPNSLQIPIPRVSSPGAVVEIVDELKTVLDAAKKGNRQIHRPESARSVVLRALEILYKGRGQTSRGDGSGWFLTNRSGVTGMTEIQEILGEGLLDAEGKRRFEAFVKSYDFNLPGAKTSVGFPPQFSIGDDAVKSAVLTRIQAAPTGPDFQAVPKLAGVQRTVRELLGDAVTAGKIDSQAASDLDEFVGTLESNHYDKSVAIANDPGKQFINYFGRDQESRKVLDAFTKLEKGHVLMTGKAGVGKTTILKMLSDGFVQGKLAIRNEAPPVILEVPITAVTNQNDPTAAKMVVKNAQALSKAIDRRVILYVDEAHISTPMTRNALKGFLTDLIAPETDSSRVNLVFSTTSAESRTFMEDSAFSRRFSEVHVPEFDREQTIQLIKQAYEPLWRKYHKKDGAQFTGIDPDAYDYAYRYAAHEQPHAGNPTGTKELLEAAIVRKMNEGKSGAFALHASDVQGYIREHLKLTLMPGDPEFNSKFKAKWDAFNRDYVGNDGAKAELEDALRSHFGQVGRNKMTSLAVFGPPGGGKSYGAEKVAEHFFDGGMLTINGAEFKNGGLELNKLIGSPAGTVGSEEQRSILTKFIKDHPQGGIIKVEEADYLHEDVIQLLTNMITDKKFTDGLGHEWDTSRFVLWMNSNIGQDHMIPKDAKNKMNWEQFNTRRRELTEKAVVNGKEIERVKPAKMQQIFDQFVGSIVTKSNPGGDTSAVAQEANKQKRRYRGLYIMPPDRAEIEAAARNRVQKFIRDSKADFGVTFEIPQDAVDRILDVDHFEFEKGYSYANDQLEDKLFKHLQPFLHERGKTIQVALENGVTRIGEQEIPSHSLVVKVPGEAPATFSLGAVARRETNPWGDNPEMMARLRNFGVNMHQYVKGNAAVIQGMKQQLLLKAADWNTRPVFTLLGTTGNGKTETFKAMAKAVYNDENAFFKISGLNHPFKLGDFFRPPTGVQGGKQETEFERWFMSRKSAGGGVICLDELLSFSGLGQQGIADRVNVINELYDMLDEGYIRFGNRVEDARGFIIGVTGNAMQEAFKGIADDPDSERLIAEAMRRITRSEVTKYFSQVGMDAPKVARLGQIYVMGPQPRSVTESVGHAQVARIVKETQSRMPHPIEISVDENAVKKISTELTTVELGMREVNRGFEKAIKQPLNTLPQYFPNARKIEMKMDGDRFRWFVDGKEVGLEAAKIDGDLMEENWNYVKDFAAGSLNHTPQLADLDLPKKLKFTSEALHGVATHEVYGHWMADALLNRRNNAEAISLIPGEGYLGYVRHSEDELYDLKNLSKTLKEAIALNAGHRAVFLTGNYAPGGGHGAGARAPNAMPTDDLGKIDRLFDSMINNRMLPGVSEGSSEEVKAHAKEFLHEALDETTDGILRAGLASGEFKPVYDRVIQNRFLGKDELDEFVHGKIRFEKFGDPGEFFTKQLAGGLAKALEKSGGLSSWKDADRFSKELLARVHQEGQAGAGSCSSLFERVAHHAK